MSGPARRWGRGGPARPGAREWGALFLLPFGWLLLAVIGWLLGVVLLWLSPVWTVREKVLGTVVVPGGLSAALILGLAGNGGTCPTGGGRGTVERCAGWELPTVVGAPLLVVFVLGGVAMPIVLARRALARRA